LNFTITWKGEEEREKEEEEREKVERARREGVGRCGRERRCKIERCFQSFD